MKLNRAASTPGNEPIAFVFRLRVPPRQLEHELDIELVAGGSHPSRVPTRLERLSDLQGPDIGHVPDDRRKRRPPALTSVALDGLGQILRDCEAMHDV